MACLIHASNNNSCTHELSCEAAIHLLHTFQQSDGELVRDHITHILCHISVEKPGSETFQHGYNKRVDC